ncbi:helix-turn-helix transcriptional regulator [Streptomyces sp. TRM 70351]|uniref:helix-turn-helix transcriptional regulator n=1 Tax=Streptomyces sp. TRM 70351 TaxID=3116552 RepID=UPI002E7C245B|nr:helix-turn-helix transcriptional regulator [Streptomyces sp. TRM 70351]MEE1931383.1 helix-turn-helix transcriptional regulator [Streptomyces sp. TRM 70351]
MREMNGDWQLVGRAPELSLIESAVQRGKGALITGSFGMGMTQLLTEAMRRASAQGHTVWSVGSVGGHGAAAAERFDTVSECAARLRRTRRTEASRPPLLAVDDAHTLDAAAAAQLHALAATGRVRVLGAVTREVRPPLGVDQLWLEHLVERVRLGPFDRAAFSRTLGAGLGGDCAALTLENLWDLTQGHPLLLRELVEQSLGDGSLRRVGGVWHWPGLTDAPGGRLAEVVLLRLGEMTAEEYELARMLAVVPSLESELVVRSGLSTAAESLLLRQVVTEERFGQRVRLRLAEPLSGRVLASRMSAFTGRRLRTLVAEALVETGARRRDDLLRITTLRLDAGLVPDTGQVLDAARVAVRHENHRDAERLCRVALFRTEPGTAGEADARLLLAQALSGLTRYEEAEREFAAVADLPAPPGEGLLDLWRTRVDNLAWGLGRVADAVALVDQAGRCVGDAGARLLDGSRAALAVLTDRLPEATAVAERTLSSVPPGSPALWFLLPVAAFARLEQGDPEGALRMLHAHRGRLADWGDAERGQQEAVVIECLYQSGDWDGAMAVLKELERSSDPGDRARQLRLSVLRARLSRERGQLTEAVTLLRQSAAIRSRRDWLDAQSWTTAWLAGALAESGHRNEALCVLLEAERAPEGSARYPVVEDGIAHERAVVLAHTGDFPAAAAAALEVAERAAGAGRVLAAVAALHVAARVSDPAPLAERTRRLAGQSTSGLARLQADHVTALAQSDGDALAAVAQRFRAMGARPLAAEALAQAARAHQAAGRFRKGQAAWAACQELLAAIDAPLPPWAAGEHPDDSLRATLTRREREVAALVASGLSNREIAARLVLSVRTVENHLHRVYNKLGISARKEIAGALTERHGQRIVA